MYQAVLHVVLFLDSCTIKLSIAILYILLQWDSGWVSQCCLSYFSVFPKKTNLLPTLIACWIAGTLVFFLIQVVVTGAVNYFGQPGNKGCALIPSCVKLLTSPENVWTLDEERTVDGWKLTLGTFHCCLQVDAHYGAYSGVPVMDHVSSVRAVNHLHHHEIYSLLLISVSCILSM
jgi:hypothetical protein